MFGAIRKHTRLGQWDGRKRSSQSDQVVLPQLWQRPVLLRLLTVLVTTIGVTILIASSGVPFPYRIGQVYPQDLRVRVYFEIVNQPQTEWKREEAVEGVGGDPVAREEARRAIEPVIERYAPGMPIVQRGQPITERQLTLLEEEHRAYVHSLRTSDRIRRHAAIFLIVSLLAALVALYVGRFQTGLAKSLPKVVSICALIAATLTLAFVLSRPPWSAVLIPLTLTAMVLTLVYNHQFALLMSFSLALVTTMGLGAGLNHLLIMMGGLATSVLLLRNVRTRTRLVEIGASAGI